MLLKGLSKGASRRKVLRVELMYPSPISTLACLMTPPDGPFVLYPCPVSIITKEKHILVLAHCSQGRSLCLTKEPLQAPSLNWSRVTGKKGSFRLLTFNGTEGHPNGIING